MNVVVNVEPPELNVTVVKAAVVVVVVVADDVLNNDVIVLVEVVDATVKVEVKLVVGNRIVIVSNTGTVVVVKV